MLSLWNTLNALKRKMVSSVISYMNLRLMKNEMLV